MTNTQPTTRVSLSNKAYDVLKFIAQVALPALAVLYAALAFFWDFPKPTEVVGSIAAVDTFLGVLLGISKSSYVNNDQDKDGVLNVDTSDPSKDVYSLEVNTPLEDVAKKDTITLRVNKPTE